MELFAQKILALYALVFGIPEFKVPADDHWTIVKNWEKEGDFFTLEAEGNHLIEQCKAATTGYIKFPLIYTAIHELYVDGSLSIADGNRDEGTIFGYSAPFAYCGHIMRAKKLRWRVYINSAYFARFDFFPHLVEGLPIQSILTNTIMVVGAALMFFLGIFGWIVFRGKLRARILAAMTSTTLIWSLYFFVSAPGYWGIPLTANTVQRFGDIFIIGGGISVIYLLTLQGLFHRVLLWVGLIISGFALILLLFTSSQDASQAAVNICFIYYAISAADIFVLSVKFILKDLRTENLSFLFGMLIFVVGIINDILMTIGVINSVMLMPIGLSSLFISLGLLFHRQISKVYQERNDYKDMLEKSYQDKINIIQNNVVAQAVANTAQMIAHDLKKPFSFFQIALHQIKAGKANAAAIDNFTELLNKELLFIDDLLADLLNPRSANSNKLEPVILADCVKNVLASRASPGLHVTTSYAHSGVLFVDKTKLTRILSNLIGNAIDASGGKGTIWITSVDSEEGGRTFAKITIGNSGSFIPPQDIELLFTKYYTRGKERGTGLGLAICFEFVRNHGGDIVCESSQERGTEFIFTLPTVI